MTVGNELGDLQKVDGWQVWCALCGKFFDTIFKDNAHAEEDLRHHLITEHRVKSVRFIAEKAYL